MTILYFSATGNSLYIAMTLSGKIYSIPQMIKENKFEFTDDKIGIAFPNYEWKVNELVEYFLDKVTLNSNYIFVVTTYGIYSGGINYHLNEIAKRNNFYFSYINKIKMVDNYLPGFKMKSQIKNEYKKNIDSNLNKIKLEIENNYLLNKKDNFIRTLGTKFMINRSNKKQKDSLKGIKKNVYVEDTCCKCGVCTKVCPVKNIEFNIEDNIVFLNKCFNCYSCLHNCPSNCIHIKNERSRDRFRNKNISLKEIIESNNQN